MVSRRQRQKEQELAEMDEAVARLIFPFKVAYFIVYLTCLIFAAIADPLLYRDVGKRMYRFHIIALPLFTILSFMAGDWFTAAFFIVASLFAYGRFFEARDRDRNGLQTPLYSQGSPMLGNYLNWHPTLIEVIANPILVLAVAAVALGGMWVFTQATGDELKTVVPLVLLAAAAAQFVRNLFMMLVHEWHLLKLRWKLRGSGDKEQGLSEEEQDAQLRGEIQGIMVEGEAPPARRGRLKP